MTLPVSGFAEIVARPARVAGLELDHLVGDIFHRLHARVARPRLRPHLRGERRRGERAEE